LLPADDLCQVASMSPADAAFRGWMPAVNATGWGFVDEPFQPLCTGPDLYHQGYNQEAVRCQVRA
jgi:hypothetical protein